MLDSKFLASLWQARVRKTASLNKLYMKMFGKLQAKCLLNYITFPLLVWLLKLVLFLFLGLLLLHWLPQKTILNVKYIRFCTTTPPYLVYTFIFRIKSCMWLLYGKRALKNIWILFFLHFFCVLLLLLGKVYAFHLKLNRWEIIITVICKFCYILYTHIRRLWGFLK